MDFTTAPSIPRVCLVGLLAVAALPLVVAAPASAAPYPLPGIGTGTGTFTAPAVEPVREAEAMRLTEGGRCRGDAAALALGLRETGMSPQGARYIDYLLAEDCEGQAEDT